MLMAMLSRTVMVTTVAMKVIDNISSVTAIGSLVHAHPLEENVLRCCTRRM